MLFTHAHTFSQLTSQLEQNKYKLSNLFMIFNIILQDYSIGLLRFMPHEGDAICASILLMDSHHLRGSWKAENKVIFHLLVFGNVLHA